MRLRFTIRDLLWLTALVAVLMAWWLDHRFQVDRYQSLLPPQIVVYPVTMADPNAVLKALQTALAGVHDVRLMVDTKSNFVVAQARPREQDVIHAIIDKLKNVAPLPKNFQSPAPHSLPTPRS
jgi:hypothetical protein